MQHPVTSSFAIMLVAIATIQLAGQTIQVEEKGSRSDYRDVRVEQTESNELKLQQESGLENEKPVEELKPIEYVVDLSDSKNHYVTVTMIAEPDGDNTELMMAVWTPGSYLVREYARHIDSVEALSEKGKPLVYEKTRKNRWNITTKGVKKLYFRYRVYCNEMSVRTNWVGRDFAVINGAPTFVTVVGRRNQNHEVQLVMPKQWKKSATSLVAGPDAAHQYVAKGFDELVDSPIVAGNLSMYPFSVGGVQHHLVNVGETGIWDGAKAASDLKLVVQQHQKMWDVVPYDRYLFLNVIGEAGGGLEHDNSCLMLTSRNSFRRPSSYESWLSLASHEFFHTWNVRRLRPSALATYDYENEVYTPSLWIAEGVTSYYEDLLLVRAGLMTRQSFINRLSSNVVSVQRTHGRKLQSLRESSFDSWIKFYRSDENSSNTRISYYSKGAVVAFLLDAKIRSMTEGKKSLDDVMRLMFKTYAGKGGYAESEFRKVASDIAGQDLSAWFKHHVDSTQEVEFAEAVKWFGLDINAVKQLEAASKGDDKARRALRMSPWVGFSAGSDGDVSRVELESPATRAGIHTGDEIIAINGFRLRGSPVSQLGQYSVGEKVDLMIARRGRIQNLELTIGERPLLDWSLRFARRPSKQQKANMKAWLTE